MNTGKTAQFFGNHRFLIVDDISTMRSAVKMLLMQLGAQTIHQASSGQEALKILARERIDVVLSDWNMPAMSGIELLDKMRGESSLAGIPFIMITAEASRDQIQRAIAAGVSGILVKPFTAASLATRAMRACGICAEDAAEVPAAASAAGTGATIDRATVLVVDDTPDNLHLLAGMMRDDYRIKAANCGEVALSICHSDAPPDLVLLDIMMPGMDGFEVAQRLREHPASEHIPIIFVTAMDDDASKSKGMALGAVDFISKPIDPDALKIRVRNFMRYIDLRRQLQADVDDMLDNARLRENVEAMTRHDIKGPLAGIAGIAFGLAASPELPVAAREKLRMIESAALEVIDMVTRSIEIHRIEAGTYTLRAQPVELIGLVRQQVELIAAGFAGKSLRMNVHSGDAEEIRASGDPMLSRSLFQNLLKNACEAAPEKSDIAIHLSGGSPIEIRITNPGTIPPEIRGRFFDKFATAGKAGGSGFGTYSAKLLAEAQRGQIEAHSNDARNETTVVVTLPAAKA